MSALLGALVAGCQSGSRSCISWADVPDEALRVASAELVVDAAVGERLGERQMFGVQAAVWDVEVMAVVKGDVEVGARIEVASTPPTCTNGTYPDGDPLETMGPLRLYLRDTDFGVPATDAGLALISPYAGTGSVGAAFSAAADH